MAKECPCAYVRYELELDMKDDVVQSVHLPDGIYELISEREIGKRVVHLQFASVLIKRLDKSGREDMAISRSAMGHLVPRGEHLEFHPVLESRLQRSKGPYIWKVTHQDGIYEESLIGRGDPVVMKWRIIEDGEGE